MGSITVKHIKRQVNSLRATWADYLLVLLIVALTGFQFCFNFIEGAFFFIGPLSVTLFVLRKRRFTSSAWIFIGIFLIWTFGQYISRQSELSALSNFFVRFMIYIFAAYAVNQFEKVFVRIITFFAAISIPLWLFSCYVPGGREILLMIPEIKFMDLGMDQSITSNPGYSLGLYYVSEHMRNSGPFWEPGMFAVFLNIALAIKIIAFRKPFDRTTIILLVTLFTTFSTTGYIATLLILTWYYLFINLKPKSLMAIIVLGVAFVLFLNSDFGQSKIEYTIHNKSEHSRFTAALYHFAMLKGHYITGCGFDSFGTKKMLTSPNGLSLIFYFWGIPFALYYFGRLYFAAKKIVLRVNSYLIGRKITLAVLILFITLLVVVFSQDVSTRHFYYFLLAYSFVPVNRTIFGAPRQSRKQ